MESHIRLELGDLDKPETGEHCNAFVIAVSHARNDSGRPEFRAGVRNHRCASHRCVAASTRRLVEPVANRVLGRRDWIEVDATDELPRNRMPNR